MLRIAQSVAVTAFFLVMAYLLVRDHVIPSWDREGIVVDRDVLTDSWANQDEWLVLRFGDTRLGATRTVAERVELEDHYVIGAHFELANPYLRGRVVSVAQLNRNLELEKFRVRLHLPNFGQALLSGEELWEGDLPTGAFELAGVVEGRQLLFAIRRDDAAQFRSIRIAQPVTLSDSLTPIMRGQMLSKGVAYSVDVYDPLWASGAGTVKIEYLEDVIPADDPRPNDRTPLKKVELRMGTARTWLYVDQNGTVIRREVPILADDSGTGAASFLMDRVESNEGRDRFPGLMFMPEQVTVSRNDVTGTDRGEVIRGFSAFSFLSKSLEGTLFGRSSGN